MRKQIIITMLMLLMLPMVATADIDNADYLNVLLTNSSGHFNITADYTANGGEFSIQPPTDEIWEVHRVIITIRDAGINRLDSYGAIIGGVKPGWYISEHIGTSVRNLTPMSVETNGDIGMYNYDITIHDLGAGDDYIFGRWTFAKGGEPIFLRGSRGDKIDLHVNGDYTGLEQHTFAMQGRIIREDTDMNTALALLIIAGLAIGFLIRRTWMAILGDMVIMGVSALMLYNNGTQDFMTQGIAFLLFFTGFVLLFWDLLRPAHKKLVHAPWGRKFK